MADLIERQAAIDAVIKRDANCGIDSAEVLKTLPSAQPEHNPDDERKIADLHKIVNYLLSQPEPQWIPCRDKVIEKLRDYIVNDDAYDMDENAQGFNDGIQTAITVLSTFEPQEGEDNSRNSRIHPQS